MMLVIQRRPHTSNSPDDWETLTWGGRPMSFKNVVEAERAIGTGKELSDGGKMRIRIELLAYAKKQWVKNVSLAG